MFESEENRRRECGKDPSAPPPLLWKYFLLAFILSAFIQVSQTVSNVDQLQGEAGFRMASLHWKYANPEKSNLPSFRIRYCEMQSWGLHRCRYQLVEPNASRNGRQDKVGSSTNIAVEIGGLRMATNYSFQVVPQETGSKGSRSSQIALQTKGFSAKATKCLADSSEVSVETGPFFAGRISVDESEVPGCFVTGDPASPQTQYIMSIKHRACGSQVNGSKVTTVILVQENLPILTHSTRKFVVLCSFSPESFVVKTGVTLPRDTSVAKAIDFSGIIRLSPQGANLLIAQKDQVPPRRGSVRDGQSKSFTKSTRVDETELIANENTLLQEPSSDSPLTVGEPASPISPPLDSRRQSRAYFQPHTQTNEISSSVPSAEAAVQPKADQGHRSGLRHSGWEGFLVLGLVSVGIVASISSLLWFVKSYSTGAPSNEDALSDSSSITDDDCPSSISSLDEAKSCPSGGSPSRTPHNLDTRSELEVELDFEFSEERNTSLILRNNYGNCHSGGRAINPSNFHLQLDHHHPNGWKNNPPSSIV